MLKRVFTVGAVLVVLVGCGTFVVEGGIVTPTADKVRPDPERESPAHPAGSSVEPTSQPTPTDAPTATPAFTLGPTPTGDHGDWLRYISDDYGFAFLYPPDWTVEPERETSTLYQHALIVQPPDMDTVALRIAYKRLGNDMMIGRTGVGAGELVDSGTVMFLSEPVKRQVLVGHEQGQHITILYGQGEIERGNMVFTLNLDCGRCYDDTSGLLEPVEALADMIIASFELL